MTTAVRMGGLLVDAELCRVVSLFVSLSRSTLLSLPLSLPESLFLSLSLSLSLARARFLCLALLSLASY